MQKDRMRFMALYFFLLVLMLVLVRGWSFDLFEGICLKILISSHIIAYFLGFCSINSILFLFKKADFTFSNVACECPLISNICKQILFTLYSRLSCPHSSIMNYYNRQFIHSRHINTILFAGIGEQVEKSIYLKLFASLI